MSKQHTELEKDLALALDLASRLNINIKGGRKKGKAILWGNPSPFQDKINELLVQAGRKPVIAKSESGRKK